MNSKKDWSAPADVSKLETVFGGSMDALLPAWEEIPADFRRSRGTKWNKLQSTWFFSGLPDETEFKPKAGIDPQKALAHLAAIQNSFQPKHEHKEAGVAWLMSLWFDDIVLP